MYYRLDHPVKLVAIDCTQSRTLHIQCRPGTGAVGSAVVTVKEAFSGSLGEPAYALKTPETLDLTGATITVLDVADVAFVVLEVTTEQSGGSIDIGWELTGSVAGVLIPFTLDADDETVQVVFPTTGASDMKIAAVPAAAITTAVYAIKQSVGDLPPVALDPAAGLDINGTTYTTLADPPPTRISLECTTAQSGLRLRGWAYLVTRDPVT